MVQAAKALLSHTGGVQVRCLFRKLRFCVAKKKKKRERGKNTTFRKLIVQGEN